MEELIQRFLKWAEGRPDIRAAFVVGSQARTDRPADEWSDLDLGIVATEPERYLSTADWLEGIGRPCLTFRERTVAGTRERRVLFEDGRDVDFNFLSRDQFQQLLRNVALTAGILRRGVRVLLDRDGLTASFPVLAADSSPARPPEQAEFLELINEFWFRAVWVAKKLRRGELYIATSCCDGILKRLVREMIERHARARRGWDFDTWHDGRFLEQWADPRAVAGLRVAYAHYDEEDTRRALIATMDLFRWLAKETAERLGYPYPAMSDECATALVQTILPPR